MVKIDALPLCFFFENSILAKFFKINNYLLKEICIPFAPTLSSELKIAMLLDTFWSCDMFSY